MRTIPELRDTVSDGTVLRGTLPADEVTTLVLSEPEPRPDGIRFRGPVPTGGPLVAVPAYLDPGGFPARMLLVTAELDPALRRQIRVECAELEAVLTRIDPAVVLPLLDHGLDPAGRPYLLVADPPAGHADDPDDPLAAARAWADGLRLLTDQGLVVAPPALHRTGPGRHTLDTPLPPVLSALVTSLGARIGHEPPEVLAGGAWTPAAQVYACAAALQPLVPPDSPGRDVLRRAMAADPAERPADPDALAATLGAVLATPVHLLATTGPLVPAAAPAGERPLGSGYLLDTPIGRGATGVVWAGRRRRDNAPVAVKLLRGDLATDPDTVNRFLRERTVLVRLQHPNLVRVYDLVAEGDDLGIVMELVDGENLRARAGRVRLDLADAATVIAQVADALAEVHAAGLVHRDVKPENVLVTERDGGIVALLSDFGIARAVDGAAHTDLIATPTYVAPELITGDPPGPPVDVYALGVTAYELLAGRPPFSGPGLDALLQAHVHTPPTRPPGLADDVWDLVEACLRKEPAARPKIADVAFRWSRLAGTAGSRPLPELAPASTDTALSARRVPEPPAPEPPKRRRGLVAAAAVAVLGVAGGVAIAYSRDDPTPGPGPRAGQSSAVQSYHLMPATVRLTGPTAHLTWPDGTALPGLSGYVVLDERFRPVSETLPPTVTSYTAPLPGAGRRACFLVLAVGVSDPTSATPPPPACVTTPSPRS